MGIKFMTKLQVIRHTQKTQLRAPDGRTWNLLVSWCLTEGLPSNLLSRLPVNC
jgi:hypothetical protein